MAERVSLSALRVHAQAATPGQWEARDLHGRQQIWAGRPGLHGKYALFSDEFRYAGEHDAAFIAAANPAVVLLLVEAVEAAQAVFATNPVNCPECGGNDQTGAHERWCNVELGDYDAACTRLDAALEPFTAEATDA